MSTLNRILDDVKNDDIIYKKSVIKKVLNDDPDLKTVLGQLPTLPQKREVNKGRPTEAELEERKRIEEYNRRVSKPQILSFLKVNDIQKEVLNFVMFDISDERPSYTSEMIKQQYVTVLILVHEDDMETEYGIDRVDLLAYIIKDLLCWSNKTGISMKLYSDEPAISDSKYYSRTLKFLIKATNTNNFRHGMLNNSNEW